MGPKQIDVTCPCCSTILTIDVLTRQILRREEPREATAEGGGAEERWGKAQARVDERSQSSLDKLDQALAEEKGKAARLDDLFKKAQDKLSEKEDDDL